MAASTSELQIALHPLAMVACTDHFTRLRVRGHPRLRALGLLFGAAVGSTVHVTRTAELIAVETPDGGFTLDVEFIKKQRDLTMQVFAHYELVGWYSSACTISEQELAIHQLLTTFTPSPIFMVFQTTVPDGAKSLPISFYQAEHTSSGVSLTVVPFAIDATEPERIAIEHVAKVTPTAGSSALTRPLEAARDATHELAERLEVILKFLHAVKNKTIVDHSLLRQVASICASLPIAPPVDFDVEFGTELNDAMILALLTSVTKSLAASQELLGKVQVSSDKSIRGRGLGGTF